MKDLKPVSNLYLFVLSFSCFMLFVYVFAVNLHVLVLTLFPVDFCSEVFKDVAQIDTMWKLLAHMDSCPSHLYHKGIPNSLTA